MSIEDAIKDLRVIRPDRTDAINALETWLDSLIEGDRESNEAWVIRLTKLLPLHDLANAGLRQVGLSASPMVGRIVLGGWMRDGCPAPIWAVFGPAAKAARMAGVS